jgi:hypothetical protein
MAISQRRIRQLNLRGAFGLTQYEQALLRKDSFVTFRFRERNPIGRVALLIRLHIIAAASQRREINPLSTAFAHANGTTRTLR